MTSILVPRVFTVQCPHRRGSLLCDRTTPHDPNKTGGHTYTASDGSHVPDRHIEGVQD